MRRLLVLLVPAVAAAIAVAGGASRLPARSVAHAQTSQPAPVARVNSPQAGCNQMFLVNGSGWPANTTISIAVDGRPGVVTRTDSAGSFEGPMPLIILHCPGGGSFTLTFSAPDYPAIAPIDIPVTMLASGGLPAPTTGAGTSPRPPDTGSGATTTGPSTREIILVAGAGSLLIGMVLLAAIAAMSQAETPARRR